MAENVTTSGTLCVHRGAKKVTLPELQKMPTPTGTHSWKPIPHAALVENIMEEFDKRGIQVVKSQYAVLRQDNILFGVMDLSQNDSSGDFRAAFGFRTSNDKSLALRAVVGSRVFVCDNLALSGDEVVMKRKHTINLNIKEEIKNGVDKFFQKYEKVGQAVNLMKSYEFGSPGIIKEMIYDAFVQYDVMPLRLLPKVHKEYFEPSFPEFAVAENLWRLNNAFTHVAKELLPNSQMEHLGLVGRFFNSLVGVRNEFDISV